MTDGAISGTVFDATQTQLLFPSAKVFWSTTMRTGADLTLKAGDSSGVVSMLRLLDAGHVYRNHHSLPGFATQKSPTRTFVVQVERGNGS